MIAILLVAGGLIALLAGGDTLVRGAVTLAEKARLPPLVIGVVVVGFGTSMPELVTSVGAAMAGMTDLAWGNIVGSNIANSLLILGAASLRAPIALATDRTFRDSTLGVGAVVVLAALSLSGAAHVAIGLAMLALMVAYILDCLRRGRSPAAGLAAVHPVSQGGWFRALALTTAGLALLIAGGQMLTTGAIEIARIAGMTEAMIGLTVVAIGTSLPELVTSVVAAWKGHPDVAFGNVAGSNLYNILFIGGATMTLAPARLPSELIPVEMSVLVISALVIFALATTIRTIPRAVGAWLVAAYLAFLAFHVAAA